MYCEGKHLSIQYISHFRVFGFLVLFLFFPQELYEESKLKFAKLYPTSKAIATCVVPVKYYSCACIIWIN